MCDGPSLENKVEYGTSSKTGWTVRYSLIGYEVGPAIVYGTHERSKHIDIRYFWSKHIDKVDDQGVVQGQQFVAENGHY